MLSFARYLLTAGAATCLDIALVQFLLSLDLLHQPVFFAATIALGAFAGMCVNFGLSRRFVFTVDERPAHQQFTSFVLVSLTTLALRLAVAYALVALFALPALANWLGMLPVGAAAERLAHLGAIGIVTIYSFLAHKHVSFAGGLFNWLASRRTVVP
ncbi:GtrA family protein [Devosia sp. Root635]|uniref:GtrA family protein n=1 Tax=Devosia sp. Root635 TaxID=1736575 RepID=UPI0006FD6BB1|nr:GtrA family protein [Devosia sp. Root635]KRA45624.1 hypothetical protein ASD80_04655 [Devosia sp. Root635]